MLGSHRVGKAQSAKQKTAWQKALPCQSVQKAYTNSRTHDINTNLGPGMRAQTEQALGGGDPAAEYYDQMTRVLQTRDLTINLNARAWFLQPNNYESYAQMYERAIDKQTGEMILTDTAVNKATDRAFIDDNVTFPEAWRGPRQPSVPVPNPRIPIKFLPKGPTRAGGAGGLDPRFKPSTDRIMGRMMTGNLVESKNSQGQSQYKSANKLFNPKTKQVFAALNYGRRPHGSSTYYGMSHFVLNPDLKVNAIYFPRDTFYSVGSNHQVSYQTLGAIYLHSDENMRQAIWDACVNNFRFPDTDEGEYLLEAHIFESMRFTSMSELHLYVGDLDPRESVTILQNAKKFCDRWRISLSPTS